MSAYITAARWPAAYPMIGVPVLAGQLLAYKDNTISITSNWLIFCILQHILHGFLYQAWICMINDWADEENDKENDKFYLSGGSRVLASGRLTSKQLLKGALIALLCDISICFYWAHDTLLYNNIVFLSLTCVCWFGGYAYSVHPIKLSFRGFGEIAQAFFIGFCLPCSIYFLNLNEPFESFSHFSSIFSAKWSLFIPLSMVYFVSNITTALPDYPADKAYGRQTYPVRMGEYRARVHLFLLLELTAGSLLFLPSIIPFELAVFCLLVITVYICAFVYSSHLLDLANHADFERCKAIVRRSIVCQLFILMSYLFGVILSY